MLEIEIWEFQHVQRVSENMEGEEKNCEQIFTVRALNLINDYDVRTRKMSNGEILFRVGIKS